MRTAEREGLDMGCQLCDKPATRAVEFWDDDGMNDVRCTAYLCEAHYALEEAL